tara:strand:+ start:8207 stop:8542 length:336 start_codon:yes stop_codon:yes gene_type:complete
MDENRDRATFTEADLAVDFVRDNAKEYGRLVGWCKYLDHKKGVIKKQGELDSKKTTVAERQAEAETSAEYKELIKEIKSSWQAKATLETLLKAAEMKFELYRSSRRGDNFL